MSSPANRKSNQLILEKRKLTCDSTVVFCRATITEALGGEMEFEFFHWWFNSIFLACACLTMLLFYGQYKQRIQDTDQLPIYYRNKE